MTFLAAIFVGFGCMMADEVSVGDVTIPQGGQVSVNICLMNSDKEYTAGQMLLALPDGVTAVLKDNGDPATVKGNRIEETSHTVGASHLDDGTDQFTIFSISSEAIPGNEGSLFSITVTADAELVAGTKLEGQLANIEMTTTDGTPVPFNNQTFTITVGEPVDRHLVLDENSTITPEAAVGVDVRVKRTIKGGEWSTICLPFDMTAEQVTTAFGSDVQLAKFSSWSPVEDDGGAIVGINVGFETVTTIEANVPLIIKTAGDVSEFVVDGVDVNPDEAKLQVGKKSSERGYMYGNYVNDFTVPEENVFLSGGKFYYSVGKTPMMGYRGYFEFKDVLDAYYDVAPSRINIIIDGATTGIELNKVPTGNDRYYNLSGQLVERPTKGLYISNGKKVVVK